MLGTDKHQGRRCGSIFVNIAFKTWLKQHIGEKHYWKLDPYDEDDKLSSHSIECEAMAELMETFEVRKQLFSVGARRDVPIQLPGRLKDLDIPGKSTLR